MFGKRSYTRTLERELAEARDAHAAELLRRDTETNRLRQQARDERLRADRLEKRLAETQDDLRDVLARVTGQPPTAAERARILEANRRFNRPPPGGPQPASQGIKPVNQLRREASQASRVEREKRLAAVPTLEQMQREAQQAGGNGATN